MTATPMTSVSSGTRRTAVYKTLYFWVLIGIVAGAVVGAVSPDLGIALEPVGVSFVNLIKMVIAPIIFCTVVTGIASMDSMKSVGRVGGKALLYFEALTTAALVIGLVVVNVVRPGADIDADPSTIEVSDKVGTLIKAGEASHWYDFIFHIFPSSLVGSFAEGDVLQVLFIAIVFAIALHSMGERGRVITQGVETFGQALFGMVRIVMYAAPLGAFGAMAFTIGKYGLDTLANLAELVLTFNITALIFVLVVLGGVLRACGINVFSFLRYFRAELLVVLGTSSSESVLPQLMRKLEHLGCSKPVVGLTVPAGYSFNLDGTCIYLTLAALFVAQAEGVHLGLGQQLAIVAVLLLTSKGAAGVTGSGFIVLAATLSTLGTIPVAGIMLVFGVDKFMSECRALTNMCGNAVASVVVSKWEGQFDAERARRVLAGEEIFESDLLVSEDTLVTEHIDDDAVALLGARDAAQGVHTTPRLDGQGPVQQGGLALLEREAHEQPAGDETSAVHAPAQAAPRTTTRKPAARVEVLEPPSTPGRATRRTPSPAPVTAPPAPKAAARTPKPAGRTPSAAATPRASTRAATGSTARTSASTSATRTAGSRPRSELTTAGSAPRQRAATPRTRRDDTA